MRIQLVNRRQRIESEAVSFDDNIFLSIKDHNSPRAIQPQADLIKTADLQVPSQFQCFENEKIQRSTPAQLRGVGCTSATGKIMTAQGPVPINALQAGDLVLTRDNGFQPVRWVGQVTGDKAVPSLVKIDNNAIEAGVPDEALLISGRQKVLLSCASAAQQFGVQEVFVRAADLLHMDGVSKVPTKDMPQMMAILLDHHQVLRINNTWTESLRPDAETLSHLGKDAQNVVAETLPNLKKLPIDRSYAAAREVLRSTFARQFKRDSI